MSKRLGTVRLFVGTGTAVISCIFVVFATFVGLLGGPAVEASAAGKMPAKSTVQALMREKLKSAQDLLGALTVQDFTKMQTDARTLKDISRSTLWYKSEDPEFARYAKNFQASADFLQEQATKRNLEGVTMGYFRLTLDCLQCHHRVRDQNP